MDQGNNEINTAKALLPEKIFAGKYEATLNMLYHQTMAWRFGIWDRLIRAMVGMLAVLTFSADVLDFPNAPITIAPPIPLLLSLSAMAAAIILNVVPVSDFSQHYVELYRLWNAHRSRWETLDNRFQFDGAQKIDDYLRQINDLTVERSHIQANEPEPWQGLLKKCQARANLMFLGRSDDPQLAAEKIETATA